MPYLENNDDDDDNEDMQKLFSKVHPIYDLTNVNEDESFKRILMTADSRARPGTAMRLGTSTGVS